MRRIIRLVRARDDERGVALAAVLGIGMVVMILVATMASIATSGAVTSNSDRDYANAMSAAYAGLADYQAKVNGDNAYATKYGSTTAPFSSGDTFTGGTGNNNAFTSWVAVPDSTGSDGTTFYRYAVDNSVFDQQGLVRVQVTGKAGNTTRTLIANVKPDGFSNYLYWTNFESGAPSITGEKCENVIQNANFTNRPSDGAAACGKIQFASGDVLSGPVRSNDVLLICGADFKKQVQSAIGWTTNGCSSTAGTKFEYYNGYQPEVVSTYTPPSTISAGKNRMYSDDTTVTGSNVGTGCLYTGPTKIKYNGDGTMTIWSPLSLATNLQSTSPYGSAPAKCGTLNALHSSSGATVNTSGLAGNLIYVQNEPTAKSDPNYWLNANSGYTAKNPPSACLTDSSVVDNGLGYPMTGSTTTTTYDRRGKPTTTTTNWTEDNPMNGNNTVQQPYSKAYGCSNGDLFVSGTYDQAMTLDSENFVYVTDNLQYPTTRKASTVLGLVGQQAVFIYNPMLNGSNILTDTERVVDASILSNQGTFTVENFAQGSARGKLSVNGSIAQDYRGAVGTSGGAGYLKNYGYDTSLATYTPPFFPQPVVTTYKVTSQVEVKPAYDASGNPLS